MYMLALSGVIDMNKKEKPEKYYTAEEAATLLKTDKNKILQLLREQKIFNSENIPFGKYRVQGLFVISQTPYTVPSTGMKRTVAKTMITKKGVQWIANLLNLHSNKKEKSIKEKKRQSDSDYYQKKKNEKRSWKLTLSTPWTKSHEPNH